MSDEVMTYVTEEGEAIGWDLCGNKMCNRHISLTDLDDCWKHPVMPAYLRQGVGEKGKTVVER